jgi:hypothetical protein
MGHQMEFDSKQWLSQTDEMQSEPMDFEKHMLSKAFFTSDKLKGFPKEGDTSQKDVEESNAPQEI